MKIFVNANEKFLEQSHASYDDVVKFAGYRGDTLITITYHAELGGDLQREGTLTPGKTVELAEGMRFNAYHTGNA